MAFHRERMATPPGGRTRPAGLRDDPSLGRGTRPGCGARPSGRRRPGLGELQLPGRGPPLRRHAFAEAVRAVARAAPGGGGGRELHGTAHVEELLQVRVRRHRQAARRLPQLGRHLRRSGQGLARPVGPRGLGPARPHLARRRRPSSGRVLPHRAPVTCAPSRPPSPDRGGRTGVFSPPSTLTSSSDRRSSHRHGSRAPRRRRADRRRRSDRRRDRRERRHFAAGRAIAEAGVAALEK